MIQSRTQGILFGVLMSYSMALGMELYNTALNLGIQLQPGGIESLNHDRVHRSSAGNRFYGGYRLCGIKFMGKSNRSPLRPKALRSRQR